VDTRTRILVVEDIDTMRETWMAVFERAGYRVDGAATAEAAIRAIDRCAYHVALVDIMLAGKEDIANRDGAKVLQYLTNIGDTTRALVLSGQENDITLVRDLIKQYNAYDYLAKWDVREKGNNFLLQKIKDSLPPAAPVTWDVCTRSVLRNWSESAFVSEALKVLKFGGGFENLSRSLIGVCQHLVPLLGEPEPTQPLKRDKLPDVFSGSYWSRGQGTAIELLLFGKGTTADAIESVWHLSDCDVLHNRSKGDLSVVVVRRPDLIRAAFSPSYR
jgi:CheY-like chemotaxis protein